MVETFTVGDSFEWKIDCRHGYHPHKLPSKVSVKAFIKKFQYYILLTTTETKLPSQEDDQ